ncbi:MAG: transcriptional regulator [Alphaproteobacteria bacterium]|nr:transcriptional regulator [Alphaproteobacteria bacterium]
MRDRSLQDFVVALQASFAAATKPETETQFITKLFSALEVPGTRVQPIAMSLPVCSHLKIAFANARARPQVAELAKAFEVIEPQLAWKRRASSGPHASENWLEGHANAVIIGLGGLEERSDVTVGVSLMAPDVRYPDHTHPPEELYMVLSDSHFQHGDEAWRIPGIGGTFHNSPGIQHAMASIAEQPLLAIWTMLAST